MKEIVPPLCSTEFVENNLNKLTLIDATWYLPNANKDAFSIFLKNRLPNSRFLSINDLKDKETNLPNMLPSAKQFSSYMEKIKISPNDHVVIYDQHGIFSAPRAFWLFKIFNHAKVSIMNGGLPKWQSEGRPIVENGDYAEYLNNLNNVEYNEPLLNYYFKTDYSTVLDFVRKPDDNVHLIDARPITLYLSGHIPKSINLSFDQVLDFENNYKQYKSRNEIQSIINNYKLNFNQPLVSYCTIGLTACIVHFAIKYVSQFDIDCIEPADNTTDPNIKVYDGSWSEYSTKPESIIDQNLSIIQ